MIKTRDYPSISNEEQEPMRCNEKETNLAM
jgi:hypothetical protein